MARALSKAARLARGMAMFGGLAVTLALLFGVATTALAAVPGDPFKLGRSNVVNAVSKLGGSVAGPSLQINNNSENPKATALKLNVKPGHAPLKVKPTRRVAKLNADNIDGKSSEAFLPSATYTVEQDTTVRPNWTKQGGRGLTALAPLLSCPVCWSLDTAGSEGPYLLLAAGGGRVLVEPVARQVGRSSAP